MANGNEVQKRMHYFTGQLLREQDFSQDQSYHADRQHRHNRLLHSSGIAEGLQVSRNTDTGQPEVAPGTAVDDQGRQIVLQDAAWYNDRILTPDETTGRFTLDVTPYTNQTVDVFTSYHEQESDEAEVGGAGLTRAYELPRLEIVPQGHVATGDMPMILARLTVDAAGQISTLDIAPRHYAGLRLPGGATLSTDGAGQTSLTSDLRVSGRANLTGDLRVSGHADFGGNVGIGTTSPQAPLDVNGTARMGGVQSNGDVTIGSPSVRGDLTVHGNLAFEGGNRQFEGGNATKFGFYINTTAANSRSWIELWGDHDQRAGELTLSGTFIDFRHNSNASASGTIGMRLTAGGRLGIGTTNPQATLEVAGNSGRVLSVGVSSGSSTANIDLAGHVQLKEHGSDRVAYLQARDDTSNRDIGLQLRVQKAGSSGRQLIEALRITPDGDVRLKGRGPIQIRTYSASQSKQTNYSTRDWHAAVIGFESTAGDIAEGGSGTIIQMMPEDRGGNWFIRADFRSHHVHESWIVRVMFIRRELVST